LGSVKLFPNLEAAIKGVFNRVLTKLELGNNSIGDNGAKAIAEALKVNAVVTELGLNANNIGPEGAIAIAEALKVNAVVTTLNLMYNSIGAEGAKAIAEALKVNAVVTTLYLYGNSIGDEGAIAIAEALKVNAVLKFFPNASTTVRSVKCLLSSDSLSPFVMRATSICSHARRSLCQNELNDDAPSETPPSPDSRPSCDGTTAARG
jgi:Ran GTPase-activating protein (RanGAP) involved in mRNA processing and transport